MTTSEMLNDVRKMTESNSRDYPDAEIQCHIDREYEFLQELLKKNGCPEITHDEVFEYTMSTSTQDIPRNLDISRVEVLNSSGRWVTLKRNSYGCFKRLSCKCDHVCDCCGREGGVNNDKEGHPMSFIQSVDSIELIPFESPQTIRVFGTRCEQIDWNDPNFEPRMLKGFQELLTLRAAMRYPCVSQELYERRKIDYNEKFAYFLECTKKRSTATQMGQRGRRRKGNAYPNPMDVTYCNG